jgi:F-type H+-transporting ATPase subunit b
LLVLTLWAGCAALGQAQHTEAPAHAVPPHTSAAEAAAEHGAAPAGGHGDEHKPALLQYDPGASIWTIIIFVVLLIVLRLTAWNPILRSLKGREEFITKSIADAKAEREQAAALLAEYKRQIDRAREEATAIVGEGRRDAEVAARKIHEQARQEADELLKRARREIQLATDTARKELHDEFSQLAVNVAGRVIGKTLSAADHRALVADSLKAMQAVRDGEQN